MYQSVGNELLELYAEAMELPLYRANITGKVLNQNLEYTTENVGDEVEDLYCILKQVKTDMEAANGYTIQGVSSGNSPFMFGCKYFSKRCQM